MYRPDKVDLVQRAFQEIEDCHAVPEPHIKEPLLRPVAEIFTLIPELIDSLAQDLRQIADFGIKARHNLEKDPKIMDLLKHFDELGKRIESFGDKAVRFSLSKLPAVLHSDHPTKGARAHMSKKVRSGKFNLHFQNMDYRLGQRDKRERFAADSKKAFDNIQNFIPFLREQKLSGFLEGILTPATNDEHHQGPYNFMTSFFSPMFERGLQELEKMLDKGLELKENLPATFLARMNGRIGELFEYTTDPFSFKANSLKFLGADAYRMTAPVEDLLYKAED